MTNDPKTAFEFDPLPGDLPGDAVKQGSDEPTVIAAPEKKRGRKPKAVKPERKKRGPRRVQASATEPITITDLTAHVAAVAEHQKKIRKPRKHHGGKSAPIEYDIIGQIMLLSLAQRRRVLAALNKVFG